MSDLANAIPTPTLRELYSRGTIYSMQADNSVREGGEPVEQPAPDSALVASDPAAPGVDSIAAEPAQATADLADQSANAAAQPVVSLDVAPVAGSHSAISQTNALKTFGFDNPFAAIGGGGAVRTVAPASQPSLPDANRLATGGSSGESVVKPFHQLSAAEFVDRLRLKFPALNREAWIMTGLDAEAILEVSSPSLIAGQLTEYLGLAGLLRDRVAIAIKTMILADESVIDEVKYFWGKQAPSSVIGGNTAVNATGSRSDPVRVDNSPFSRASEIIDVSSSSSGSRVQFSGNPVSPLQPAYLFAGTTSTARQFTFRPDDKPPAFLSEVGRQNFSFEHASPAPAAVNTASLTPHAGGTTTANAVGANGMQNISITLHQPTQQSYNWTILDNLENKTAFMQFVKKNRRERVICDPANMRSFASLLSMEVREEVCRIHQAYPQVFGGNAIRSYADIDDELLFKILFFKFGPRNALDAKTRLSEVKFRFDDSNTLQDRFAPKLRRYCQEWRQSLLDFKYTCKLWPLEDDLSHTTIVDAFLSCFEIEDMIMGPDGRNKVPKCTNMQPIRDMIRENKHHKLDVIMDTIVRRFDNLDATIRADPLLKQPIQPWRKEGQFNARKRKWNQVGAEQSKGKRRTEEPQFPRCANCGSRRHPCGERTCFFWGHPKAKGKDGVWPEGTPSLRLEDEEMKTWRQSRHDVFYSYEENKKNKPTGNNHKGGNRGPKGPYSTKKSKNA